MDIGYARISTAKQDLDRQIDALSSEGHPRPAHLRGQEIRVSPRPL